jgi:drug/metabolite transporter (DMT)-like permease
MRPRDLLDLLLLGAIWGGAFPMLRVAAPAFGPVALITVRLGVAAVLLGFMLRSLADVRANAGRLFALGLLNSAIPFTLFAFATLHVTAGLAALLNATVPIFGAILTYFVLGERLSAGRVLGIALAFAGIASIVWESTATRSNAGLWGVASGLTASALYATAAIYTRHRLSHLDVRTLSAGSVCGATLAILPFGLLAWPAVPPSTTAWLAAIALGTLCSAVAYLLYFRLLRNVGPARAVTVTFLIPVFGILWGAVFLHEPVTGGLLLRCVLVLLGTALATGALTTDSLFRAQAALRGSTRDRSS